jgi:hypothetical protein
MAAKEILVRDFIFPLLRITSSPSPDGSLSIGAGDGEMIGTGFFVGGRGSFMTAGHILDGRPAHEIFGLFVDNRRNWTANRLQKFEVHKQLDVAIGFFESLPTSYSSPFLKIERSKQEAGVDYHMWSYPENVAKNLAPRERPREQADFLPDMIFLEGYIRRRYTSELPFFYSKGDKFLELSEIGGSCLSGSPIIAPHLFEGTSDWPVIGIYVAEETTNLRVGYAVPSDMFADWASEKIGTDACR